MNPATMLSFAKKTAAALLLAGCLFPTGAALASGSSGASNSDAAIHSSLPASTAVYGLRQAAVPSSLQSFTETIVSELSKQDSFQNWKDAGISYDPLGPGTHSWLVTVSRDGKPVGYLILTSTDDGNYMLSEYGREDAMPFNAQALREQLKERGILRPGSKLAAGANVEARYFTLLPVWKITQPGKSTIYLHAITGEELPMPSGREKAPLGGLASRKGLHLTSTMLPKQQRTSDPYDNLLWLQSPKLSLTGSQDLLQAMRDGRSSLVFTSPGRNADFGAPFVVNGLHAWQVAGTRKETLYAATGPNGTRLLPASELMARGEFRSLNVSYL